MLKALEILRRAKTHFSTHAKINEAIEELEDLMKSKSCEGCKYAQVRHYAYGTVWFKTVESQRCQFCIREHDDKYEPKE